MADSKRQQIIAKIDARLKTIKTAVGYNTNAGTSVLPWLSRPVSPDSLLSLVYRDPRQDDEAATTASIGYHRHSLTIEIEVLVGNGAATIATMRQVFADLITAIGADPKWDGLAESTLPVSDRIEIDQESKIVAGGLMTFTVVYRTKAWNAYI